MDARADDAGERLTRTARASRSETRTAGEAATAAKTDCSAGTRRRTTTTTRRRMRYGRRSMRGWTRGGGTRESGGGGDRWKSLGMRIRKSWRRFAT